MRTEDRVPGACPRRILWGGATAASQYEGGLCDGKGLDTQDCRRWRQWDAVDTTATRLLTEHDLDEAVTATGRDVELYPFRRGSRGYDLWQVDTDLLIELGIDVYRLSLSWSRLFPTGFEDRPNEAGVRYYDRIIDKLHRAGIRIFITLNHYAMPLELNRAHHGWGSRAVIDSYLRLAEFALRRWGDVVDYWLPINEINAGYFSPFNGLGIVRSPEGDYDYSSVFNGLHYQMVASAAATRMGRDMGVAGRFACMVSCFCYYPLHPSPEDNAKLVHDEQINQWWCSDVLAQGHYGYYAKPFLDDHGVTLDATDADLELLEENTCDVVSFSYYSSSICSVDETRAQVPGNLVSTLRNPCLTRTEWGWQIDPIGLRTTAHKVFDRYHKPVIVAENGLGARDELSASGRVEDDYRIDYLRRHFEQAEQARREGVGLEAYLVWGLIDIVSAGSCEMEKRYGVIYVDADNTGAGSYRRFRKDSFHWFRDFINSRRNCGPEGAP